MSQTGQKTIGKHPTQDARFQIPRLAFLLAGLLIAVTAASLAFVGFVASQASQRQALASEQRLFDSALREQFRAIVKDMMSLTHSDKSVSKLVRNFDPDYARQSLKMLWSNHRHNKGLLISGNGNILAESFEDYAHITDHNIGSVPDLVPIIAKVQKLYANNRVRVPGGFGHRSLQGMLVNDYAIMGFVHLDGRPALFGAMPIIPDAYDETLPDGNATVLLSAHHIDDVLLEHLNKHLAFSSLTFQSQTTVPTSGTNQPVLGPDGTVLGYFSWESQARGAAIWETVIPVIALLSISLAVLAFGIAWRIGTLTRSLQSSEAQNRYLALHDSLSGLANRLQFLRALENATLELPQKAFAVLHCDLDLFKEVNDTFGHAAGDIVIKAVAERMTKIVGRPGLVCRVGGDEFMIIYRASTDMLELRELCQALIDTVSRPIPVTKNHFAEIGLSIGVSLAPMDGSSPQEIVAQSDAALYRAKDRGRGRYEFYSDLPGDCFIAGPRLKTPIEVPAKVAGLGRS